MDKGTNALDVSSFFLFHIIYFIYCLLVSLFLVFSYSCWLDLRTCFICFSALKVLEGKSYRLQNPWVGIVNRSQADINKNVDMILARRKEREYFATSPDYGHLASKMGSEYLAKLLSQVCTWVQFTWDWLPSLEGHISDNIALVYSIWNLLLGLGYQVSLLW